MMRGASLPACSDSGGTARGCRAAWQGAGSRRWMFKMNKSLLAVTACVALLIAGSALVSATQDPLPQGPTLPFEAVGACPFEGCVYREWTAQASVVVRTERRAGAPASYQVQPGEKVTALTGVVVILRAGRVQFRAARRLQASPEPIHIEPGQTLYLLNYLGEGFTNAWFNGRLYTDVDTAEFYNFACDVQPNRCAGTIIEPARTEWWVQVRNHLGRVGWTDEPEKFSDKNAIFDDVQLPPR